MPGVQRFCAGQRGVRGIEFTQSACGRYLDMDHVKNRGYGDELGEIWL
jgi:hypothetical protein